VVLPELINCLEKLVFLRELLLDIIGIEDVFKIHPLALECQPLIDNIRNVTEMLFPSLNGSSDFGNELRSHHGLDTHLVIFELDNGVLDITNDESVLRVSVRKDCEGCLILPEFLDF